jgi:SAM-dependent methyltransferase
MAELCGSMPFDRVAQDYDRTRGGPERGEEVVAALAPLLPPDGPLLEIGVGTGLVAAALARRGRAVVGVDLSLPMLRHAADRMPGRVVAGDALRLPVGSDSVAATVMIHVLHVVGDVAAALAEAGRVVRPGGRVVVSAGPEGPPPAFDVAKIIDALYDRLGLQSRRLDQESAVTEAARKAGLGLAERTSYWPSHLALSPADAVDRIVTRSWSWFWRVDEQAWPEASGAAVEALRRLPDQDRPRTHTAEMPLLAFEHRSDARV